MPAGNGKITIRQAFIIFMVSTLSASIRLFPTECARHGGIAGWLAPVFGAVPLYIICTILNSSIKNYNVKNISDVFNFSLGKIAGKAVLSIYLLWAFILYFLYIRYFVERLLSSIYPNANMKFFIFTMLVVVFIASRGNIEFYARFAELSFLIFNLVVIIFLILLIPNVKIESILPITYLDIVPAIKATVPILGIWGYITLVYFLGNHIDNETSSKRLRLKVVLFLAVINTLMILLVNGSLGYKLAKRMPLPFFSAVKMITFMETLDRLESVLLSIWVIADFIVITFFAYVIINHIKSLFSIKNAKYFTSPVILLGYVGSQSLASSRFELELFSSAIGITCNIIMYFVIPVIIVAIGKLRKKI